VSRSSSRQYSLWHLLSFVTLAAVLLGSWRAFGGLTFVALFAAAILALPWIWRPRWFYVWLLPILWTSVAWINFSYPGDEYAGFGVGSLAGLWILAVIGPISDMGRALPPVLLTGAATVAVAGVVLDKLRVPWLAWVVIYLGVATGLFLWTFGSYPSVERALAKNGSYAAYILPSMNLGLYAATITMLIGTGLFRLAFSRHRWAFPSGAMTDKDS
jgi:hypothetical protein